MKIMQGFFYFITDLNLKKAAKNWPLQNITNYIFSQKENDL